MTHDDNSVHLVDESLYELTTTEYLRHLYYSYLSPNSAPYFLRRMEFPSRSRVGGGTYNVLFRRADGREVTRYKVK